MHRDFLAELACQAPLLPGRDVLAFAGIDSWQKRVFGYQKQGAAFGFTKISGKSLRVRDMNTTADGQEELFPAWRYHAVITDSPSGMIQAEEHHRDHAIIEQVFADWNDGPLACLPSGSFAANAAWLACAAITCNLLRAAGKGLTRWGRCTGSAVS